MTDRARVLDMSSWWRSGGADWYVIKDQFDGVVIRAGVGSHKDVLLEEFVNSAVDFGIPYATYHIPGKSSWVGLSLQSQADLYRSWYGVADAVAVYDIEPPMKGRYDLMLSPLETVEYILRLKDAMPFKPMWYSNLDCLNRISWPAVLSEFSNWAARYYYKMWTGTKYRNFEDFIVDGRPNPWWGNTIYNSKNVLWQFTDYGDPDEYGALIKQQVDLSYGTVDKAVTMRELFPTSPTVPPEGDVMATFKCNASSIQNVRNGHSTSNPIIGKLARNEQVTATKVWSDSAGNVWAYIKPTYNMLTQPGWAAIVYGSYPYLVSVD